MAAVGAVWEKHASVSEGSVKTRSIPTEGTITGDHS